VAGFPPPQAAPQWSAPQVVRAKKSNAVWWVLGGIVVFGVLGVFLIIVLLALAGMDANQNSTNDNNNSVVANQNRSVNTNSTPSNVINENLDSSSSKPSSLTDDFGSEKWRTGNFQFGDIWYVDDEFHMRAKERMYLVMYAPNPDYTTENATVRVTARSVDGVSPASGYGLIVHGEKSPDNALEDYALLIYTGTEPQYQVVLHKNNLQKTLVPWTKSSIIRPGTSPNQLEIRSQGDELSFYVNGRYLTRITDTENNKRGVAGLYTSETGEVAFDDLEIER
jgi:cytoskeletal protein RodZ